MDCLNLKDKKKNLHENYRYQTTVDKRNSQGFRSLAYKTNAPLRIGSECFLYRC